MHYSAPCIIASLERAVCAYTLNASAGLCKQVHALVRGAVGKPRRNKVVTDTATSRCMFEYLAGQLTGAGILRDRLRRLKHTVALLACPSSMKVLILCIIPEMQV